VFPEKLALRVPIFVGPTAEVVFEGIPYSMPPEATHVAGTLFLYEDRLHIVAGRFEAHHRRRRKGEPAAPLPEHRAAKIAAVHGKRAKLYEKRQQVLNLGPDALTLLTEITHREPTLASRRVEDLFALLETFGDDAMREAIGRAVRSAALTVAGVNRALRTLGARRPDGAGRRAGAAQPRGTHPRQLTLPVGRAESKRGAP
jgi:hypothetical protein